MAPKRKQAARTETTVHEIDPEKHELVLDGKGLCGFPVDEMNSGVRSLRVLVMPKGKYAHVPKLAGRYFVLGNYRVECALKKVHFKKDLNRDPEMVTTFLDYGMVDPSVHGVMLETYLLPLKVSQGVYQSQPRYTPIEWVSGFSKLDAADESDLSNFLKRQDDFVVNGIKDADGMLTYIGAPLADRLDDLKGRARGRINSIHDEKFKQGGEHEKKADDERDKRIAKLDEIYDKIRSLSPENYDATLTNRVQCMGTLDPADHTEQSVPQWIASPLRRELTVGCALGNATCLVDAGEVSWREERHSSPVRRGRSAGEPASGGGIFGEGGSASGDGGGEGEDSESKSDSELESVQGVVAEGLADDDDDEDDEEEPPVAAAAPAATAGSKIQRRHTQHYSPLQPKQKAPAPAAPKPKQPKQPKASAAKAGAGSGRATAGGKVPAGAARARSRVPKGQTTAEDAPYGISQVTGRPYARPCGSYNRSLTKMIGSATAAAEAEAAMPGGKPITELAAEASKLREQNAELKAKLEFVTSTSEKDVKVMMLQTKAEMTEQLLVQFQAGLEKGLAMAAGMRFSPPASAGMAGLP